MDLISLYAPLIDATVTVSPDVADHLFDTADENNNLNFCALIASKPGVSNELAERCRTHPRAQVRAAWLANPDRTDTEIRDTINNERAGSAFADLARNTRDHRIIGALADQPAISLKVVGALARNPWLDTNQLRAVVDTHTLRERHIPSSLAQRAAVDPYCHNALFTCWKRRWVHSGMPAYIETVASSPFLYPQHINDFLAAAPLVGIAGNEYERGRNTRALQAIANNPALTEQQRHIVDTQLERFNPGRNNSVFGNSTPSPLSRRDLELIAAFQAGHPTGIELSDAYQSTNPHIVAAAMFASTPAQLRSHKHQLQTGYNTPAGRPIISRSFEVLAVGAYTTNPAWSGKLLCGPAKILVWQYTRKPTDTTRLLLRAALEHALDHNAEHGNMRGLWTSLLPYANSIDDVTKLSVDVFVTHARQLPTQLQHDVVVWLSEQLGTIEAVTLLGELVDRLTSDTTVGELVDTTSRLHTL